MENLFKLLIINPGSTSTKIAVFENDHVIFEKKITHTTEELKPYPNIISQLDYRKKTINDAVEGEGINPSELSAIVGRGGLLQPIESGVYEINEKMINQLKTGEYGEHASNLGGILAYEMGSDLKIPSYIADPVVVDELKDVSRLSGIPQIKRKSIFHALNHKAVARRAAKQLGKSYEDCNFVVAHLGGGISVAAHEKGKCIDVNNALGGEGPYTPERAGGLPAFDLIDMCFSGTYKKEEIKKLLVGQGGLTAYLGINDGIEIEKRIEKGDKNAEEVFHGMAYQLAKEIGAYSVVLRGDMDAIIITGGLSYSDRLVGYIEDMVKFIAPIMVFKGEDEMLALCESGLRILNKEEEPKTI